MAHRRAALRWDLLDAFRAAAEQAGIKSIPDFNRGDNEGMLRLSCQAEARPPLVGGERLPQAGAQSPQSAAGNRLPRRRHRVRRPARRRRALAAGRRHARTAHCRGEVILAAGSIGSPQIMLLSGVGPAAQLRRARHPRRRRPTGRRRQSAGSFAAAHDLQGRRHHHAQRALSRAGSA